jgi:hypothetical protein
MYRAFTGTALRCVRLGAWGHRWTSEHQKDLFGIAFTQGPLPWNQQTMRIVKVLSLLYQMQTYRGSPAPFTPMAQAHILTHFFRA